MLLFRSLGKAPKSSLAALSQLKTYGLHSTSDYHRPPPPSFIGATVKEFRGTRRGPSRGRRGQIRPAIYGPPTVDTDRWARYKSTEAGSRITGGVMFLTCAEEVNVQLFIIFRRFGVPPFGIYLDVPGKNQKLGTYFTRTGAGRLRDV